MSSPIGTLTLDAEKNSKKKGREHQSTAPCGCAVTLSWFTANSYWVRFETCVDHVVKKEKPK